MAPKPSIEQLTSFRIMVRDYLRGLLSTNEFEPTPNDENPYLREKILITYDATEVFREKNTESASVIIKRFLQDEGIPDEDIYSPTESTIFFYPHPANSFSLWSDKLCRFFDMPSCLGLKYSIAYVPAGLNYIDRPQ